MNRWLIVGAITLVIVGAAYWYLTGGMTGRATPPWLTRSAIAHKGIWTESATRPENSLASFQAALDRGLPVELDVQLSSDGHVVVFHDYELERMTGEPGKLADKTLSQLQGLRLLGGSETIPSLTQVLELVDGRVPLYVEIKNEGTVGDLEDAVARDLAGYDGPVAVMSFNPYTLARMAKVAPAIPRGQLSSAFHGEDLAFYEVFLLRNLMMNWTSRPDFIAYDLQELPTLGTRIQKLRGRPLIGWTAKTQTERSDAEKHCAAVICDPEGLPR